MGETQDLTNPAVRMLRQMGHKAFRMNSGRVRVKGGWMHLAEKGTADILCFPRVGPVTWIETKVGKNGMSEDQERFRDDVRAFGHRHLVARNLDEVREALQ